MCNGASFLLHYLHTYNASNFTLFPNTYKSIRTRLEVSLIIKQVLLSVTTDAWSVRLFLQKSSTKPASPSICFLGDQSFTECKVCPYYQL